MNSADPIEYSVCTDCRDVIVHDYGYGSGGAIESLCHHHSDEEGERRYAEIAECIERKQASAAEGIDNPRYMWDDYPPLPHHEQPVQPILPDTDVSAEDWRQYARDLEAWYDAMLDHANDMVDYADKRDSCGDDHFSWSSCDICGSSLGGNRYNLYLTVLYNENNE